MWFYIRIEIAISILIIVLLWGIWYFSYVPYRKRQLKRQTNAFLKPNAPLTGNAKMFQQWGLNTQFDDGWTVTAQEIFDNDWEHVIGFDGKEYHYVKIWLHTLEEVQESIAPYEEVRRYL